MKTHISDGNTKLFKIPNVSLSPCKACNHDCDCKKGECYAIKAFKMYPSVRKAWDENLGLCRTRTGRETYFRAIVAYVQKKQPRFFRWHIAGDILDQKYLASIVSIARNFPDTKFLVFTKMHGLRFGRVSRKPKNLEIVFSMWKDYGDTRKNYPRAWMLDPKNPDTRIPADAMECPGYCADCMMCWNLRSIGRDVYFVKH